MKLRQSILGPLLLVLSVCFGALLARELFVAALILAICLGASIYLWDAGSRRAPGADESASELGELERSLDKTRRELEAKTESLSLEREELATLMSSITDAILAVDLEGVPLFFNSRFALLFDGEDHLSQRTLRLGEIFKSADILGAFKSALTQGQAATVNALPIDQVDGSKRFYTLSVSPLRKRSSGEIYGAAGIFHDVTELKSAEQIRIDFVANVSHELRTPLTAIKGYTDTLIEDLRDGRQATPDFLETISRNANRLMSLINDLLDLSSLESTDLLQKAQVDPGEITSRVFGQMQGGFEAKHHRFELQVKVPSILADPKRLEQVLVNLLDNAGKYTPAGGLISVEWVRDEQPGQTLLKVRDNGPGIPLEHHARLFERFYRVDKARSREQGGTGLGLAIVKHIMQRHDGSVWVESEMGKGSVFICRFPS